MQGDWHYTNFLEFLDHWQSLLSGILALVAAIIAIIVTIRIERWKARVEGKDELLKEIRLINAATMVAFGISNSLISAKNQHIKPLKNQFDQQKASIQEAVSKQKTGQCEAINFQANFVNLPVLILPLSVLQAQIFEKLSLNGRPILLMTTLIQAIDGLNRAIIKRNQLVEFYKSTPLSSPNLLALHFGFPLNGQVNQEYPDTIECIFSQTDDGIFFATKLCEDLSKHGDQLSAEFKSRFGKGAPRITKPDFSKAILGGLMPREDNYTDWVDMFRERVDTPSHGS